MEVTYSDTKTSFAFPAVALEAFSSSSFEFRSWHSLSAFFLISLDCFWAFSELKKNLNMEISYLLQLLLQIHNLFYFVVKIFL